ncbi:MAG: indole-3-glycerol-phosphate synthase [Candidatus Bathyarchaeota archaeon]|nr:indole-3-glycerol-phosphate synthase [Candidatus Bathyarchaeota archaeon]
MGDFLDLLVAAARKNIEENYYRRYSAIGERIHSGGKRSLRDSILGCRKAAIISEVKFASPSSGVLRVDRDVETIANDMIEAGAVGLSILTEPKYFSGSLENLLRARLSVNAPLLMKDIILSGCQINAAYRLGADAILLIADLFKREYCDMSIHEMIDYSHSVGLEVLLEVHDVEGFKLALSTEADMIGINNRDLKTLKVDINTTRIILEKFGKSDIGDRPVISESGIKSPEDVCFLRRCGADAFLVGSSIMTAKNIRDFLTHLVNAYEKS